MENSQAIRYHTFGKPNEVLQLDEVALPARGPRDVVVKLLAATINPSDMGMILGKYGKLKELPAVAGREGIGEIVETGSDVTGLNIGDRVRFPEDNGTWQTATVCPAEAIQKVPRDLPIEVGAMAFINPPTAWRILRDSGLREGDWVIQNAANSAVGIFVIQMAHHLGMKTINLVRREELITPLKELGADIVLLDNDDYPKQVKELTGGHKPLLALNSVGGESALRLIKALQDGGTHITFGAMDFSPTRFPTRFLIFNNIHLKGFWLDKWYRDHSRDRIEIMNARIYELMRKGAITAPVAARYPLSRFQDALATNDSPRFGKVLLVPDE